MNSLFYNMSSNHFRLCDLLEKLGISRINFFAKPKRDRLRQYGLEYISGISHMHIKSALSRCGNKIQTYPTYTKEGKLYVFDFLIKTEKKRGNKKNVSYVPNLDILNDDGLDIEFFYLPDTNQETKSRKVPKNQGYIAIYRIADEEVFMRRVEDYAHKRIGNYILQYTFIMYSQQTIFS